MLEKVDKRARARIFRDRLRIAMERGGMTQAGLARQAQVDRSTLSQALGDDGARVPNAHFVGLCAEILGVSADWLLGLSERPESAQALLANALDMPQAPRALIDEQVFAWHQEAAGYKIRHMPAALPDLLKTEEMLRWEYHPHMGRSVDQAIHATRERLSWIHGAPSDFEIAIPLHEIESFAAAEGYYRGVPTVLRRAQLQNMIDLHDALYPRLRLYFFDARKLYSAPLSIFGPLLVALYVGSHYLAFRDSGRIRTFSDHFDGLVRGADIGARNSDAYLRDLMPQA